jgi:hypothetical protein
MTDSDSVHFSDKFSYKILFILSYHLKDMEITRFKHFLPFSKNENRPGTFLTQRKLTGEADRGTRKWLTGR